GRERRRGRARPGRARRARVRSTARAGRRARAPQAARATDPQAPADPRARLAPRRRGLAGPLRDLSGDRCSPPRARAPRVDRGRPRLAGPGLRRHLPRDPGLRRSVLGARRRPGDASRVAGHRAPGAVAAADRPHAQGRASVAVQAARVKPSGVANQIPNSPVTLTTVRDAWRSIPEVPVAVQDAFARKSNVVLHRDRWRALVPRAGGNVFAWLDGRVARATGVSSQVMFEQTLESDERG